MDIDQESSVVDPDNGKRQIILPKDALPNLIHVLPQESRPLFPGQTVPLIMDSETWLPTLQAIQQGKQDVVGVLASKGKLEGLPTEADLHTTGTVCRILRVQQHKDQLHLVIEGLQRFTVSRWLSDGPPLQVQARYLNEPRTSGSKEERAYAVAIINTIKELIPLNPLYGEELKVFLNHSNLDEPSLLADFAASLTSATKQDLQAVLDTLPLLQRMEKVVELLQAEVGIASAQMEIRQHVEGEISSAQREAILRQQLKYIQKELGISKDDKTAELEEFQERLEKLDPPNQAQQRIDEELQKLSLLEPGSPEYGVTRNYLDWLTSVPWGVVSKDQTDLAAAAKALASHHEGLEDVKERMLEFLALGIMKGDAAGSIICLAGPPGVGKTSLGRAVAEALGRKFYRFSVGGMRDEAEIKGHRRTYVGAMPGKLIQALKDTGVANPVVMLDEIDKLSSSYQGDPASALLEVLDPEQNDSFRDHYLDTDVDLSKVLFICTANQLDTIPGPLLDRMEVIHLSGYLDKEKQAIARKHLWPRQVRRAGLKARGDVSIDAAALRYIVENYAREAGVRRLDKALAAIVRKLVVKLLAGAKRPIKVGKADIETYLGPPTFNNEAIQQGVGVVTGLAWTSMGGVTLPVEATRIHNRGAGLKVTGQLGDVMQESASIAYSHVVGNAEQLQLPVQFFDSAYIHMHVPAGATPKDGPSAGVTMASSLVSLALDRAPKAGFAMTGELTLTGKVYPVGGIREKLLAAKRLRIKQLILPEANQRDFNEVPDYIRAGIKVHFVKEFTDVMDLLFP